MEKYDVIIIGSGPAGLTAAIYAARARLKTLVLAGVEHGGQLMQTTLVENFPGFKDGVDGPTLMMEMQAQAKNQGAEFLYKYAVGLEANGDEKIVKTDEAEFSTKSVILAVGSSPRRLNIPGENEYYGHGVSTCATCDAAFYREKIVAVVGGGDSAMEEASFISKFASKVFIVHRRDELKASKAMQERVFNNPKIEMVWNSEVKEVVGVDGIVDSLKIYNNVEDSVSDLKVDGMFLAIGHIPNSDFLNGIVEMDEAGFIKVEKHTYTSAEGIFVCGDVYDHRYQQAITAAGMGCMAAIDCERWLAEKS